MTCTNHPIQDVDIFGTFALTCCLPLNNFLYKKTKSDLFLEKWVKVNNGLSAIQSVSPKLRLPIFKIIEVLVLKIFTKHDHGDHLYGHGSHLGIAASFMDLNLKFISLSILEKKTF